MSDIIFARTRTPYDSYQDYHRLIELSGFPTCYVDEIDVDSDNVYIFSPANGETTNGWPEGRARIIFYQLEWETHPNDSGPLPPGVSEKWTMDAWHAQRIGARYVPIGSHPDLAGFFTSEQNVWHAELNKPTWSPFKYDVALLSYMSYRRQVTAFEMQQKGIRLMPNAWGYERHRELSLTKAIVHIHQHDAIPGVAALRLALAAAYKMPVITETCADYGIFGQGDLLRADYGTLADFAQNWVCRNDARMLAEYGESLYQRLCVENTFRRVIEGAV